MGDRIWHYENCPKCKGIETFECYEAISSCLKVDECLKCGWTVPYTVTDDGDKIKVEKGEGFYQKMEEV